MHCVRMRAWLLKVVQSVAIILMLAIALRFLMQHKDPGAVRKTNAVFIAKGMCYDKATSHAYTIQIIASHS